MTRAIVFHHGTPSDGASWDDWMPAVAARGLTGIAPDRYGYGQTPRRSGRSIADVADLVAAALAKAGADEFVTVGLSGGGPHALACAALIDGCRACATLGGVGPYGEPDLDFLAGMGPENVDEFGAAVQGEEALRAFMAEFGEPLRTISGPEISAAIGGLLPAVDRDPRYAEDWAASLHRGLAGGLDGWIDDDLAFTKPWGFALEALTVPVRIWQGDLDLMVPEAHGAWLAGHIPNATLHRAPGEGHLSLPYRFRDAILDDLVVAAGWA
jgi:pimeloyl-ACP methyl ester carboxylesterase